MWRKYIFFHEIALKENIKKLLYKRMKVELKKATLHTFSAKNFTFFVFHSKLLFMKLYFSALWKTGRRFLYTHVTKASKELSTATFRNDELFASAIQQTKHKKFNSFPHSSSTLFTIILTLPPVQSNNNNVAVWKSFSSAS